MGGWARNGARGEEAGRPDEESGIADPYERREGEGKIVGGEGLKGASRWPHNGEFLWAAGVTAWSVRGRREAEPAR